MFYINSVRRWAVQGQWLMRRSFRSAETARPTRPSTAPLCRPASGARTVSHVQLGYMNELLTKSDICLITYGLAVIVCHSQCEYILTFMIKYITVQVQFAPSAFTMTMLCHINIPNRFGHR